jgi:hypothetical protein
MYQVIRQCGRHTIQQGKREIMQTIDGSKDEAIESMVSIYAKFHDSEYYPNEDLTEIRDETGRVIWEFGDEQIITPDFSYRVEEVE